MIKSLLVVSLSVLFVAGCSNTSVNDKDISWSSYGYETGSQGQRADTTILALANAEQRQEFEQGYAKGNQEFCSQNGYSVGLTRTPYYGQCAEVASSFEADYYLGLADSAKMYISDRS
ncbi:hypothetical protein JCM19241_271 [Vibrio ishigakensis]|uniref:Lipoprotein n=1 Tax=Vibrio ishigakensis TaxID=1481914 RepID=A0A0B8QLM8_9VIBR|nr:hypothetical protein JCM19241_271 [Vibrio ishigakensis]